jgi:hypothetical protein
MVQQVVTGNRLSDGIVIFLGEDGGWTSKIDAARVADTDADAKLLEDLAKAAEKARLVVGPYLIEVAEDAGSLKPVRYRERLRAYGPSIHPEFGRPDVPDHFRMGAEAAGDVDMAGVAG